MPNLIILEEKEIVAQGLDVSKLPNQEIMKNYFFDDELEMLQQLVKIENVFLNEEVTLLYPGCGADILTPLLYLEKISPRVGKVRMVCVDISDSFKLMKTILHEVGVSFADIKGAEKKVKKKEEEVVGERVVERIQFYWKGILMELYFHQQNIARFLHEFASFDIYFEKCFRIMKDRMPEYETVIYDKLAQGGLVISDSGFSQVGLEKIEVDSRLSAYGEMIIGRKK
jgi:hypothetical protein